MGDAPEDLPSEAPGSTDDLPANEHARYRDPQGTSVDREETAAKRADVACVGEALWDLHAPNGVALEDATHVSLEPGGGAVNVALALARLGLRAKLVASVGEDPVGRALAQRLAARGVDVSLVRTAKARTGLVFLTRAPMRAVAYRSIADEALALRDALPHAFDANVVVLSGLLPSRAGLRALARAARRARREGCIVALDANLRPRLWAGDARSRFDPEAVLAEMDLVKVSEEDLRMLGAARPEDLAPRLRPEAIVVSTKGPEPTRAIGPFGEVVASGPAITTGSAIGAGDAFVAGLFSVLAREGRSALGDRDAVLRAIQRGNEIARETIAARDSLEHK